MKISYGKNQKKIRYSVQDSDLSGDRVWHPPNYRDLQGAPVAKAHGGGLAKAPTIGFTDKRTKQSGKGTRAGERKAQGQDWRVDHDRRPSKKNGKLEKASEKRKFVSDHITEFGSVSNACKAVGLSESSYYYQAKTSPQKSELDSDARDLIEQVQAEFPFYGYRRIHAWLERKKGITINEKKILRIMHKYGLKALLWQGFKVKTTDSNHTHGYAPNLLPGMVLTGINQVWVADLTYIRILTGFVYLAVILDLFSRKVVGWAISQRMDAELCLRALEDAIKIRAPGPGLVHHSDRGVQYACGAYRDLLLDHGIVSSMSAKGYCYDNAFMETWFKTLKAEEVYLTEYETFEDVLKVIPNFIENVYNKKRLHSSLNYFSPEEFEQLANEGQLEQNGIALSMQLKRISSN